MEFFRIRRTIPFMRYSLILNAISFISFGIAVAFLLTRGPETTTPSSILAPLAPSSASADNVAALAVCRKSRRLKGMAGLRAA